MKKNMIMFSALILAVVFALTACTPAYAAAVQNTGNPNNPGAGMTGTGGYGRGSNRGQGGFAGAESSNPLSQAEIEGLLRAIEEEYHARALYQSVLNSFGDVFPFNRIVLSESQHAARLVRLAEKYGVAIPSMDPSGYFPEFASLAEACQAGAEAEIVDAELYDELTDSTTHADLLRVYANLQAASLNNHLPAFQVCK